MYTALMRFISKSFFSQFLHTNIQCREKLCNIEFKQFYTFAVSQLHFKIEEGNKVQKYCIHYKIF